MNQDLNQIINDYLDFPKKGIVFKDILPILHYPDIFSKLIEKMSANKMFDTAEAVIAVDARGFIFGTAISITLKKPMIVARKIGKLPGDLITKSYNLEYGKNSLSIQKDSIKKFNTFAIVDDLLATGGTILCISDMLKQSNKEVSGLSVVVELSDLEARKKLPFLVDSQLTF